MGNQCSSNSLAVDTRTMTANNLETRSVRKMGWIRDLPDHRDHYVKFVVEGENATASKVDLRPQNGGFPIFDQGHLGSCTANALAAAYHFSLHKQNVESDAHFKDFTPSRLFIYYNERSMEGHVGTDSGAQIRDGIKTLNKLGVCPEDMWKYDDGPKRFKLRPSDECFKTALQCTVKSYARVEQDLESMKNCIRSGFPFVFGFAVFSSFETQEVATTGKVPMPDKQEQCLGGHAVCAIGFDDEKQVFVVQNSWGQGWGDKGFFYMPYEYICDAQLASDFWAINVVSGFKDAAPKPSMCSC